MDIGEAEVVCCVCRSGPVGSRRRVQGVRLFSAMIRSLVVLADWLAGLGVTWVMVEAASDYWKLPLRVWEAAGFEQVWLVNGRGVERLPGRPEADKLDAVWLCEVAERGMLRPSSWRRSRFAGWGT